MNLHHCRLRAATAAATAAAAAKKAASMSISHFEIENVQIFSCLSTMQVNTLQS